MKILLWIWQLPQNIIGFLITRLSSRATSTYMVDTNITVQVDYSPWMMGSSISLGNYIVLDYHLYHGNTMNYMFTTVSHEYGHQRQSRILGPFYLLLIGLPSLIGNIIQYVFHKDSKWYYSLPWEAWADVLGGVHR